MDEKIGYTFQFKDKYMISLVEPVKTTAASSWNEIGFEDNENFLLLVKSAPDVLIDNCQFRMNENGTLQPLTTDEIQYYKDIQRKWSSDGKRVILFASKWCHVNHLTWLIELLVQIN